MRGRPEIRDEDIPRYIALRAIGTALGRNDPPNPIDKKVRARFSVQVRQSWRLEARRLWLLAFYWSEVSSLPSLKSEIAQFKKAGADTEVFEALLIGHGALTPSKAYDSCEKMLAYSESHPSDIVAAQRCAFYLYFRTQTGKFRKEPLRTDLLDRIFALEDRTIKNVETFLNDKQGELKPFVVLRDTVGKYK